ncbi:MAG: sugar transferase [Planctomycetota bacterium]
MIRTALAARPAAPPPVARRGAPGRFSPAAAEPPPPEPDWERLDPRGWYPQFGKRALSVALLLIALPCAALLSIPIALVNWAIFRDASRILYHQPRVGYHGRVFSIVKFRTMRETSRDAFASWKEGHEGLRVTRFGRFLRNTHLDELPQLLNVLRGEMDFIGPRPEMIEIYLWACEHVPGFRHRHAILPGITGLAQVTQGYTGMDEEAYTKKLAADLVYLQCHSLRLDLEILARTAVWMLRGRGWRWQPRAPQVVA